MRAFNEPHHLMRIDECGGTNPDQSESAGDIPVRQRVVLGWPPAAPRDECDQGRKNEEQRADRRKDEISWERHGEQSPCGKGRQDSRHERNLRSGNPRAILARATIGWLGDGDVAPPKCLVTACGPQADICQPELPSVMRIVVWCISWRSIIVA